MISPGVGEAKGTETSVLATSSAGCPGDDKGDVGRDSAQISERRN